MVNLSALAALRGPSCVFVDHSFFFVFFRLFQASRTPDRPPFSSRLEDGGRFPYNEVADRSIGGPPLTPATHSTAVPDSITQP